jgi:hypothetical protein
MPNNAAQLTLYRSTGRSLANVADTSLCLAYLTTVLVLYNSAEPSELRKKANSGYY